MVGGEAEWTRLRDAIALDRKAALRSTSWGLGQIMGFNHALAGHPELEQFVVAMEKDEQSQVKAMLSFTKNAGLIVHLQKLDWAAFARGYNGPAYAANQYDKKLASAYARVLP